MEISECCIYCTTSVKIEKRANHNTRFNCPKCGALCKWDYGFGWSWYPSEKEVDER